MPSPRPTAGSPLRGRLRRGLQEEKSPRRNMLRGPSTSAAPATGPHLRLPSSPPPETSGTSLRLCCAATASPRHGPSASNPGCADDGPSRPRLPATSTPAPTSPANGYQRLPLPRHAGPTPPTDTPARQATTVAQATGPLLRYLQAMGHPHPSPCTTSGRPPRCPADGGPSASDCAADRPPFQPPTGTTQRHHSATRYRATIYAASPEHATLRRRRLHS